LSLRVSAELNPRHEQYDARLKQKRHTLAQAAVEAAVEAIEKNGQRLVFPTRFDASHVAVPKPAPVTFPPHSPDAPN